MPRVLPVVIELVLLVVCLIDAAQTPAPTVRNLPKWLWVFLIVVVPIVGPVAWLLAGRPSRRSQTNAGQFQQSSDVGTGSSRRRAPRAPDDDPEFLASLHTNTTERERLLKQWEADLERREDELRKRQQHDNDQDG